MAQPANNRDSKIERRTVKTRYDDWPSKEKADNGFWYAFYRDAHGQPHRVSLKTKNENQANSRYQDLMEQVDRGVLHYSPRPKALPFSEMVDRYLNEGAGRLRPKRAGNATK